MNAVEPVYQRDNQSKSFTYIAIPIESLQTYTNQTTQSLSECPRIVLKTFPDDNVNTQVIQPENMIVKSISGEGRLHAQHLKNADPSLCVSDRSTGRHTVIEQNKYILSSNVISKDSLLLNSNRNSLDTNTKTKANLRLSSNKSVNNSSKDELGSFKCLKCDSILDKLSLYRKHMEMHRNMKKYKCEECSCSYNVEDNLKLHMALHTKSEPTCPICDKKFQRLASLKSHIIVHEVEETFTCIECLSEFDTEDEFNNHMNTHQQHSTKTNNSPLECSICSYIFEDPEQYKEHVSYHIKMKKLVQHSKRQKRKVNTNKQYRHKCDVCDKSFSKYCLLERHIRIHSGEKPFVCHLCNRAFAQKGTLQIHLIRHSGIRPFRCTLCSATFCQKGNLQVHVQKTHILPSPGEKVFKCSMCTCIFKKVSSLNAHTTKAHARDKECDDISDLISQLKKLENQLVPNTVKHKIVLDSLISNTVEEVEDADGSLVKYVKLVDSSVEGSFRRYLVKKRKIGVHQWYVCSFCLKEFKKPSDLIRHIRVHTREKPYKCKHCDQAFSLKSTLSHHLNTHFANKQYQCIVCLKMFISIRALNAHRRRHYHSSGMLKNYYKCPTCDKVFNSVAKVKHHIKTHSKDGKLISDDDLVMQEPMVETANGLLPVSTPQKTNASEFVDKPRPHKCSSCNSTFTRALHLKRHMLIHSGERKFNCDICKKSFYSSYAKDHMKFHSGERNYVCKVCGKKFVTNTILKRHLTSHSPSRPYVCPYCRKRFKTVLMCRKHINIHKKDLQIEQLLVKDEHVDGIGETIPITNSNEASKSSITIDSNAITQASKVLFIDVEKGIIISTPIDVETENNNLQEALNQPVLYPALPSDTNKPTNASLLTTNTSTNVLENVDESITNLTQENLVDVIDSNYQTVYVSCEDLQSLSSTNLYNACLSQLKNNDPLLLSGINEIQDPNLLFSTDPTLSQITDSQLDSQNLETLIPTFNVNNGLSFQNAVLSNIDDIDVNQLPLFSSMNDFNKKMQGSNKFSEGTDPKFVIDSNLIELTDDSIVETSTISNLLSNGHTEEGNLATADLVDESTPILPLSSPSKINLSCSHCKQSLKNVFDLKDHVCNEKSDKSVNKQTKYKKMKDVDLNGDMQDICHRDTQETIKFKCTLCEKIVSNKSLFARHLLTHNTVKEKNTCSYCSKEFKKRSDLERHIRTHTGERPFKCDKCGKGFSLKSTLESHNRTHQPGGNKDFNCAVCSSYFSSKSSLRVHTLMHTGLRPYQCSLCPESFRTSGHRKSHMNTHFKSKDVKKNGQSKSAKIKFLQSVTLNTQNLGEKCSEDDTSLLNFKTNDEKEPLQMVLEEPNDGHIVEVDPIFLQQLQLNNMLLQDNIEEDLTSFIQVDINNDGEITDVKSISNDLMSNINTFERELENPEIENKSCSESCTKNKIVPLKNFECDICNKKYSSKSVLTKHKKIHVKNSIFKCTKCDSKFSSKEELENHLKLHSGYRPFCCLLCANTFREEKNLKTHMRRIHGVV